MPDECSHSGSSRRALSVGGAAEVAGLSYREMVDALVERGVPPYAADEDPETLAAERASARRLLDRVGGA